MPAEFMLAALRGIPFSMDPQHREHARWCFSLSSLDVGATILTPPPLYGRAATEAQVANNAQST
jgi:hypothetical protein